MNLHQDSNTFRQLILLAGEHFRMRPSYIEKDYWVTQILSRLAASPYVDNVVFKGGTSLSKGYHLINRFSEDVDVAVIHEGLTGNAVKTLIRNVEKSLSVDFTPSDDPANSKGSMYRKTVLTYPIIMPDDAGGISMKRMILEISAFANPFPYERREVSSLITQYLQTIGRSDTIEHYEMQPFTLNVLDYRRTLVEKIVSLTRFSFADVRSLSGKIRHFYDIYYLMQTDGCKEYVASADFREDVQKLLQHDQQAFDEPTGWQDKSIADSPLATRFDEIWAGLSPTYQNEMASLSFATIPQAASVAQIAKKLFIQLAME